MDKEIFNQKIEKLREFSSALKLAFEDNSTLVLQLNSISKDNRFVLFKKYENTEGPITGIRSEVSKVLSERDISLTELEAIVKKFKGVFPNSFGKMYKNWFNMLYMFLIVDIRDEMNDAIEYISKSTIESLGSDRIIAKKFDFTGERETGSTRCWIAFINNTHKSQTTAKQLFLNIEGGEIEYCLYDRPRNQQSDKILLQKNQPFDYDRYIGVFQENLPEIINDDWIYKPNYWRVGTKDGDTSYWEEMKSDGKVCIGWYEIGDLDNEIIKNKKGIINLFDKAGIYKNDNNVKSRKSGEIYNFYDGIKIGDIVLAQDGQSVLGIGIIQSDYEYNEDADFPHKRNVEWILTNPPLTNTIGNQTTVYQIKDVKKITEIEDLLKTSSSPKIVKENKTSMESKSYPLNQILYGPPGTGKTYHTINKSLEILNDLEVKELNWHDRVSVKKLYDKKIKEGQIVFTTFHQSMSYEDFIEGIKPALDDDDDRDSSIKYKIKSGIFKNACALAGYNVFQAYNNTIKKINNSYSFDNLYEAFIGHVKTLMKETENPTYKSFSGKETSIIYINKNDSIHAVAKNSSGNRKPAPLTKENLEKLYNKYQSISEIKSLSEVKETVGVSPRTTEFYAVFGGLKNFEKDFFSHLNNDDLQDLQSTLSDEEIVKKFEAGVFNEAINAKDLNPSPIILIIDEINRGNVSGIFGELITLVEDNKRAGQAEALSVTLPYSNSIFSVPSNLYILGTMNTADRSVEALDTALRRRFSFSEMPPQPELLSPEKLVWQLWWNFEGAEWDSQSWIKSEQSLYQLLEAESLINLDLEKKKDIWEEMVNGADESVFKLYLTAPKLSFKDILTTINNRLEVLLSKDHLIGHSYFMHVYSLDDLKNVFYDKIIPLLQEYFYGDYGKIGLILGYGFVNKKETVSDIFASSHYDNENIQEKDVYEIIDYRISERMQINAPGNKNTVLTLDFKNALDILLGKKLTDDKEA